MKNGSIRLWELVNCPLTGLSINTKLEWKELNFSKEYSASLCILGEHILYTHPSGYATLHDVENILMITSKAVASAVPKDQPYVQIEDYSDLYGASLEARRYYINNMRKREELLGLIFCGVSPAFKMSIKLGRRLNIVKFNVRIVDDYFEAITLAQKMLASGKTREDQTGARSTKEERVSTDSGLSIKCKPDWFLKLDGFSARFEVIGDDIFHADTKGYLEEGHIIPIFRKQEEIIRSMVSSESSYYFIGGVKEVKGSRKARKLYFEYIMQWYKEHPFRMYVFYGTNRLLQAAINLARPFVQFEVHVVKDLDTALSLISGKKSKEVNSGSSASNQTQRYVNELLYYLGSINWEENGFDTDVKVKPSHPFSPVFDAIALIKNDLDELYKERKKAEDGIKASLKEKNLLLKEIHHRVKNNLQVISSLLGLQAKHIKDKQALEMFEESKNRVRSMALVHEELYRSKDFANIDFTKYIKNLTGLLVKTYIIDSGKIELDVKVEDVSLGIDQAVPCGLVINELVSNALKHAFPPSFEGKGKIEITLCSMEAGEIELIVKDNGVGIPKEPDIQKTESLGMQ